MRADEITPKNKFMLILLNDDFIDRCHIRCRREVF